MQVGSTQHLSTRARGVGTVSPTRPTPQAQGAVNERDFEKAMGAFSYEIKDSSLQSKHLKEQLFNILDAMIGEK